MSFLENLNWRYATKKFDTNRTISTEDKDKILEAIRMVPTSRGLQPFHVDIITDKSLRVELREKSYDQSQITDSDFILVFSARTDLVQRVQDYATVAALDGKMEEEKIRAYTDRVTGSVSKMTIDESIVWAAKQIYIALGFAMAACAELQIDSCPMEGFDPAAYKKILNLPENFFPQVVLAVGYRSVEDKINPKVRFSKEELFS